MFPKLLTDRLFMFARLDGFQSKNRFALLHQVETVPGNRFEIGRVRLEEINFARLAREQTFLFVPLRLQSVDLAMALNQSFVWRREETDDDQ